MLRNRHMTAILWTVIMLVAVQLVPTIARAHQAHHHHASAAAAHEGNGEFAAAKAIKVTALAVAAVAMATDDTVPAPADTCKGSCCGVGSSCCCSVLAAEPSQTVLLLPRCGNLAPAVAAKRRGIE